MPLEGKRKTQGSGHKYLNADYLRYLESLYLSSRVTVEGAYSGKHTSPLKGHAQEFTDYRKYYPGDSIRTIDWKVYARTDRYVIKLSELETIMTCYLLVDSSASMAFGGHWHENFFGSDDMSKFDYACYLAAALSYLTIKQGDKVGLTLFDSNIKYHIPAGSTYSHLYKILNQLEKNSVGQRYFCRESSAREFSFIQAQGNFNSYFGLCLMTRKKYSALLICIFTRTSRLFCSMFCINTSLSFRIFRV